MVFAVNVAHQHPRTHTDAKLFADEKETVWSRSAPPRHRQRRRKAGNLLADVPHPRSYQNTKSNLPQKWRNCVESHPWRMKFKFLFDLPSNCCSEPGLLAAVPVTAQPRTRSLKLPLNFYVSCPVRRSGLTKEQAALAAATDYQHRGCATRATRACSYDHGVQTPWNAKLLTKHRDRQSRGNFTTPSGKLSRTKHRAAAIICQWRRHMPCRAGMTSSPFASTA